LHGAVAVAVGAAVAVAITLGSQALAFWLPVALAAALVVLTLGTGRGIRLRSGGRRLDLGSRAWISTGPKALPAVRPLANPSPQLVERVRRASSSDAILGAYLYETFDGELDILYRNQGTENTGWVTQDLLDAAARSVKG